MTLGVLDVIAAKRRGERLPAEAIALVVDGYVRGDVPDYQMAAWLMAVACRGMDFDEVVALTRVYVDSGERLDLHGFDRVVDKHSTGGVGDKTTLVVAPALAALGVPVAKMSGRGLDFAGGTLDKLESIPGLRVGLDSDRIRTVLAEVGMVVVEQSARLVPADGATYALRDVTGTVESLPLIAASIMSKKIAAGTNGVVLDVKFGGGALTGDLASATELATLMIEIGAAFGLRCHAVISDMDQPLGWSAGNALEIREAVDVLRGAEVPGLTELCVTLATEAVLLSGAETDQDRAREQVRAVLADGRARAAFRRWVAAQGGDPAVVDDPRRLPATPHADLVTAERSGWVRAVDARAIGTLALGLGAGRQVKSAPIDHAVGVTLHKRVGDRVVAGEPLAQVHHRGAGPVPVDRARAAFTIVAEAVPPAPTVHTVLRPPG
ncbi:thymidine phosphorylase [Micromonospora echinospora]|uniref:thymidine phosphorylase n=1 Tax=Micromonospora echinospora TaxID=1877 RepID=UPI0037BC35BD